MIYGICFKIFKRQKERKGRKGGEKGGMKGGRKRETLVVTLDNCETGVMGHM